MRFITYLKSKTPALVALGFVFILTSCGSYQSTGQDSDGIYESSNSKERNDEVVVAKQEKTTESNYYKNYFKEKANQIDVVVEGNEIFTDIDNYEGEYIEEDTSRETEYNGYAGWGQENERITVNVYNGFNNFWNRPYYGWNSWYHRPYYSFGWSYGFGNSFWCNSLYPFSYNPYYGFAHSYYGAGGYYGRGMAYNSGRRGFARTLNNSRTSRGLAPNTSRSRRSSTSTSRPRRSNTSTPRPRRSNTSTPRPRRSNTSTPRPRRPNISTPRPRSGGISSPRPRRTNTSTPRPRRR